MAFNEALETLIPEGFSGWKRTISLIIREIRSRQVVEGMEGEGWSNRERERRLRCVGFLRQCSRRAVGDAKREGMRGDCKRSTIGIFLEGRRTDRIYYSNRKPTRAAGRWNLLLKYACLFATRNRDSTPVYFSGVTFGEKT